MLCLQLLSNVTEPGCWQAAPVCSGHTYHHIGDGCNGNGGGSGGDVSGGGSGGDIDDNGCDIGDNGNIIRDDGGA
jgi:hypothetical protein